MERQLPWGVLLLLGGGVALADACAESGLSALIAESLGWLRPLPAAVSLLTLLVVVSAATSVTSNVATTTIFLPVVASLAQSMEVHPFYLMVPVTLSNSLAFVLPVSTPPNALAFASGRIVAIDRVPLGTLLALLGAILLVVAISTYDLLVFGLGSFPDWAVA